MSGLLDTRKDDAVENKVSVYFLVCKSLTINDVGVSRDIVFQEKRPGADFETGDFVIENLGGTTVERLVYGCDRKMLYLPKGGRCW